MSSVSLHFLFPVWLPPAGRWVSSRRTWLGVGEALYLPQGGQRFVPGGYGAVAGAEGSKPVPAGRSSLAKTNRPRDGQSPSPAPGHLRPRLNLGPGLSLSPGCAESRAFPAWLWPFPAPWPGSGEAFTELQPRAGRRQLTETGRGPEGPPGPAGTGAKGLTKAAVLIKCPKFLVLPPMGSASGKCQR